MKKFLVVVLLALTWGICSGDVVGTDYCLQFPQNTNCTNYVLPNVPSEVQSMCSSMGVMPGCTINKYSFCLVLICQSICSSTDFSSNPFCNSFSIYKELCEDMQMGCDDYFGMCAAGSRGNFSLTYQKISRRMHHPNSSSPHHCSNFKLDQVYLLRNAYE
jgi:hypothetical protein